MSQRVTVPTNRQPVTPGEILVEEFLKPYGMSQNALAKHLNWSTRKVSEICTGKRSITPETAMTLEDAFGASAEFWLNLQLACDLYAARKKHRKSKMLPQAKARMQSISKAG